MIANLTWSINFVLFSGEVPLPSTAQMPRTQRELNYVFVADEAFPLQGHMMRPYPGRDLNCDARKIYNYRLSRARRVVENAFGK
jgi:hypothetical protein